jgi:hypothetical protein
MADLKGDGAVKHTLVEDGTEFKGALTEQYVLQQLIAEVGVTPYYWSSEHGTGEIDFLFQLTGTIVPLEVKAEENLRARSLRSFNEKYPGLRPTYYGAQAYDAAQLINSAVVAVKGDTAKKDEMKAEMEKANFKSLRGDFKFNTNQFPIQNFYIQEAVKDPQGMMTVKTIATAVTAAKDPYYEKCAMK